MSGTPSAGVPIHYAPWYKHLYVQVLIAIMLGAFLGLISPSNAKNLPAWLPDWLNIGTGWGEAMKPLGDAFIKLIKMLIAPIIFCTVVHGIASMGDLKKVGRVGGKALLYFELVSTLALIVGMIVSNVLQPGAGMNINVASLDTKGIATFTAKAQEQSVLGHLMGMIPNTVVGAFAEGEILQVLVMIQTELKERAEKK